MVVMPVEKMRRRSVVEGSRGTRTEEVGGSIWWLRERRGRSVVGVLRKQEVGVGYDCSLLCITRIAKR